MAFAYPDADLKIVSSDGISFFVHKSRMASSSPVFADMFSFPVPDSAASEPSDGVSTVTDTPCVDLTEGSTTLEGLLYFVYHTDNDKDEAVLPFKRFHYYSSPLEEFQRFSALFEAACKYEIDQAQKACVNALQQVSQFFHVKTVPLILFLF